MPYQTGQHRGAESIFARAAREAGRPIPLGLSDAQRNRLSSQVSAQIEAGTRTALAGLAGRLGGTSSAAYATTAARQQANAGSQAAGTMADIDVANQLRQQDMAMRQRDQLTQMAGVGGQYGATAARLALGNAQNELSQQDIDNRMELGLGGLDIQQQNADTSLLSTENQFELGQGQLGLGYSQLDQQSLEALMNLVLGMGNLGVAQGQLGVNQQSANQDYNLGLGRLDLGWGQDATQNRQIGYQNDFNMGRLDLQRLMEMIQAQQQWAQMAGQYGDPNLAQYFPDTFGQQPGYPGGDNWF